MDWGIIALNFVYAILGVVLMFLSYRVFDWLTPTIDFVRHACASPWSALGPTEVTY